MSKITDHRVIAIGARYSDEKQNQISNESQVYEIKTAYLSQVPYGNVWREYTDQHTGTDPYRKQMETAYREIKAYNRTASQPVTLFLFNAVTRYFRDLLGGFNWFKKFREIGVEINFAQRWYDFDDTVQMGLFAFELMQAQMVSEQIGADIKRNNKGRLMKGFYPVRANRYMDKYTVGGNKRERWNERSKLFQTAARAIIAGLNPEAARKQFGGAEVFGCKQSFLNDLRNEVHMGRYRGYTLNIGPLFTEYEWQQLQARMQKQAYTRKDKSLANFFCRGALKSPNTFGVMTSETTRSRNGSYHQYYSRRNGSVTEARYKKDQVHEIVLEALEELTGTAKTIKYATTKAIKRSKEDRKRYELDAKRLKAELKELELAKKESALLLAKKKMTPEERDVVHNEYNRVNGELEQTLAIIDKHGDILRGVLQDLQRVGAIIADRTNGLVLNRFLKMVFPDGFTICLKNRILRTSSINAAFSTLPLESASYTRIKFGPPKASSDGPLMWTLVDGNRTAQSDLQLFWSYLEYNKLAVVS